MLKLMSDVPDNMLGVTADGKITSEDYKTVLIPAVEEKLKAHKKINMVYHLSGSFTGIDLAAIVDDAKIGLKHLNAWDRFAVVSDHQVINSYAKFFAHLMPGEVRVFDNAHLEEAKKWAAGK